MIEAGDSDSTYSIHLEHGCSIRLPEFATMALRYLPSDAQCCEKYIILESPEH
jgi:hypothetical protein